VKQDFAHVAIDGPAASGKTTVGRLVAADLGYLYLDTGAMYRALAYLALQNQTDVDNEPALLHLCDAHRIGVVPDGATENGYRVFAGSTDVSGELTSPAVTAVVSIVAAHGAVRKRLVEEQRAIAARGSVVMAGRDIGTVVLPHARYKIFLTASVEERVVRRRAELLRAGVNVDTRQLRQEIEERDRLDASRIASPLRPAADARTIDSSGTTAQAVAAEIVGWVRHP